MEITFEICSEDMNPLWSSIHKQPAMRKKQTWKKWKVLQQQENSYESTFQVNPV